jgi:threonine dehydrogenase-like Zn-dependent dehydrogenase
MRALTWHGKKDVRVEIVPDPEIINPRDAIIEVTSTAICGSDLHIFDGVIPGMQSGDILGHEFMGRVVDVGPGSTLKKGQRVVVPFTISCGNCFFCASGLHSACDNSNPVEAQEATELMFGHAMSGIFGYSHLTGGYSGGQAEYVRVPFSDVGPIVVPMICRMIRYCSCPTFYRPAGWRPKTPKFSPATASLSGAAGLSGFSPCNRRC